MKFGTLQNLAYTHYIKQFFDSHDIAHHFLGVYNEGPSGFELLLTVMETVLGYSLVD